MSWILKIVCRTDSFGTLFLPSEFPQNLKRSSRKVHQLRIEFPNFGARDSLRAGTKSDRLSLTMRIPQYSLVSMAHCEWQDQVVRTTWLYPPNWGDNLKDQKINFYYALSVHFLRNSLIYMNSTLYCGFLSADNYGHSTPAEVETVE